MPTQVGARVQILSGDYKEDFGFGRFVFGRYLGNVTTYSFETDDGSLLSFYDAEHRPSEEEIARHRGELVVNRENPKIRLDNGRVVYGCRVVWKLTYDQLN